MSKEPFSPESDKPEVFYTEHSSQEIAKAENPHNTRNFAVGFFSWFLFSNLILWIFIAIGLTWPTFYPYVVFSSFYCILLATIVAIVLFAKRRSWRSAGILAAIVINIVAGLLLAGTSFHDVQKIWAIAITPFPSDILVFFVSMISPPY